MFSRVPGRKPNHIRIVVMTALILVLGIIVLPAGAAPPEEAITFDPLIITYELGNFTSVNGEWSSSEGTFQGSGTAVQTAKHAGWPGNGWQFKNAQLITTLSDDVGTVTIKDQVTGITWDGLFSSGYGQWVIIDATGVYEGFHGVGTSYLESNFHFVCPDPNVAGACIINETTLNGLGHFDP